MTDPTTTDYDYKAFFTQYHETHKPKPKKTYADVTKAFIKYLERTIKAKINVDAKDIKMLFKNSNLAGRVESLVNRFIVLPTMLIGLEYQPEEVEKTYLLHLNQMKNLFYMLFTEIQISRMNGKNQ